MTFEVGPWQYFGQELLKQLDQLIDTVEQLQQINNNSPGTTQTVIRTVTSTAGMDRASADSRQSQGAITALLPAGR